MKRVSSIVKHDKYMFCRVGSDKEKPRDIAEVKKKWADMKSKAVTKHNRQQEESNKTGGGRAKIIKIDKWEQEIIDMLIRRKSNLLHGLDGYDSGVRIRLLVMSSIFVRADNSEVMSVLCLNACSNVAGTFATCPV